MSWNAVWQLVFIGSIALIGVAGIAAYIHSQSRDIEIEEE